MTGPNLSTAYRTAADLENFLGDPWRADAPLSFASLVAADHQGGMPAGAMALLHDWGVAELLIPAALRGKLSSYEELFATFRSVSRRDVRLSVSYGTTILGANPVWLWGTDPQRHRLAGLLRDGMLGSFAMSERDHGSDLGGCEVSVSRESKGLRLSGEKWPIGNATRGGFATVYARRSERDFLLLFLEKAALPADRWAAVDPVPTLGLRGHDMSGLRFTDCPVPDGAVVGTEGAGMALTLKALQLTRTLIAALSLGSLDTALRVALAHSRGRRLYGAPVSDLPVIRDVLVRAYLDILIGECVAIPVTRAISAAPALLSLWSSVVKYLVPVMVEESLAALATVLSARRYLVSGLPAQVFQKVERDQSIASVFEGTTHVNLAAISAQLPAVAARSYGAAVVPHDLLAHLHQRHTAARPWHPDGRRLRLANAGRDDFTAGWPAAAARARELAGDVGRPEVSAALEAVLARIDRARVSLYAPLGANPACRQGVGGFSAARTHCLLHAATSVVLTWVESRAALPADFTDGVWLVLSLQRILQRLRPDHDLDEGLVRELFGTMSRQDEANELFSLTPVVLGG